MIMSRRGAPVTACKGILITIYFYNETVQRKLQNKIALDFLYEWSGRPFYFMLNWQHLATK
jgi:hypothetical protein